LLMQREDRLAAKLDAIGVGVSAAARSKCPSPRGDADFIVAELVCRATLFFRHKNDRTRALQLEEAPGFMWVQGVDDGARFDDGTAPGQAVLGNQWH
jgi:hypothetical protein